MSCMQKRVCNIEQSIITSEGISPIRNKIFTILLSVALLHLSPCYVLSQPPLPNHTLSVSATQSLNFGAFCVTGTGGTVTVNWQGIRFSSPGIILLNSPFPHQAIFEFKLCQSRNVTLTYPPIITLTGSNGGSMIMSFAPEKGENGNSFQIDGDCNLITRLQVGGTLTVGDQAANPSGIYTGKFSITFNQE